VIPQTPQRTNQIIPISLMDFILFNNFNLNKIVEDYEKGNPTLPELNNTKILLVIVIFLNKLTMLELLADVKT